MSELITKENTNLNVSTPERLLEIAVNKDADVDKLEKLMVLHERYMAGQAKKSFIAALSKFQFECPPIKKTKEGYNYKYADLDVIIKTIKNTLHSCGLSFRFEQKHDGEIFVKCILSHVDGHSESSNMQGHPDTSGQKNPIQAIASAVTYFQRYTLINVLGLATADDDLDGNTGHEIDPAILLDNLISYNALVRDNFDTITNIKTHIANDDPSLAIIEWRDLDQEVQKALWVSPTKGGVFTTQEREALKKTSVAKNKDKEVAA